MTAPKLRNGMSRKISAAAFAIITMVIIGGGYWYYRAEAEEIRVNRYESLSTIAKMKLEQITQWRKECISDALRAATGPVLRKKALEIVDRSITPESLDELRKILNVAREQDTYSDLFLIAPDGTLLFSAKEGELSPLSPTTQQTVTAVLHSRKPAVSDFFRGAADGHVNIDAVAPINNPQGGPLGVLILRSNAESYLYPLIQSWPTKSRSAETILVRREGEEAVILNDVRHRADTAFSFRFPLSRTEMPAVQAALGCHGIFDGVDYREKKVLADLRAIPDTPWFMVTKVDRDEILAEARYRAVSTTLIAGALILLSAAAIAYIYTRKQAALFRELFNAEREQKELQEQYRTILYSIGDAVITTDCEGRVRTMNPVAERMTGWAEAEAGGRPLAEVFEIVNQDTRKPVNNPVDKVLSTGTVIALANHTVLIARDGTEYAIADSAAPIRGEDGVMTGVVLVVSDVTQQYKVRAALHRSEKQYRMLFEGMLEGFAVHEIICDDSGTPVDYRFLSMNRAFEQLTGLCASDVIGRTLREVMPNTEAVWIERYGRVALTGEPIQFEEHSETLGKHFKVSAFRPQANQFAVVFEEITQRKTAEARVARLTQLYAALSQCNQAIVHSANSEELLPHICRSVVQHGGMKMAWIGFLDEATGTVRPSASYGGGTEYLDGLEITIDPKKTSSCGPTGTAIRENKPFWCNDFQVDPSTTPWRERAERYGWRASGALPLCLKGTPVGALTIYTDTIHGLDEEVRTLLQEMANDISFALDRFASLARHKQAEQALQENRNMLVQILDSVPQSVFWKDLNSVYMGCNKLFAQAGGLASPEQIVGKTDFDLPWAQDDAKAYVADDKIVMGQISPKRHIIERLQQADGTRLWVDTSKVPLTNSTGEVCGILGVYEDITERMQTEARLRLQSGALEAAANAIVITNSKGIIEWTNAAFTVFTGYTAAEALGQTPSLLKSGKQDAVFYEDIWKTVLAGEVWNGEIINRRKNGSLYAEEMTITPMRDSRGEITHFIAVKQDITERKQIEENLTRTQRMESLGTLAAGVAHDLNNILTPIILSADMLRSAEQADARECFIATIEKCAQRGANVVNQVLTFARGAKGQRMHLQLDHLIADMEKMMHETFPKSISIATSIQPELWQIKGDPTQIHQVLLNLCINSRDAMPEGGTLRISAENEEIDENFASTISDARAGRYAVLAISDTGTGIEPAIISKIFDPFFTTKEIGKGTGLGLATVMGIVRSYGGFVTVESEENRGSTFKIFLPAEIDETQEQDDTIHAGIQRGNGETILVVDDEVFIANMTAMVLEKNGYNVLVSAEGEDALTVYKKNAAEIRIVLTDIMMPGMDGVRLTRELKAIDPQVKVIASTGQATETRQAELRKLGVTIVLSKPFDAKKLLATLHDAIHAKNA